MIAEAPVHFTIPNAVHAPAAAAVDAARFLAMIVAIEGNHPASPGGVYGLTVTTWRQHTKLPYRYASFSPHNKHVAELHLRWLERSLRDLDQPVTVYTLSACWRHGLEGGIVRMHAGRVDYAERTANLYFSAYKP